MDGRCNDGEAIAAVGFKPAFEDGTGKEQADDGKENNYGASRSDGHHCCKDSLGYTTS